MPPKVVCVVGPTACGKTKMGVLLARACHGEVVSCDSMQIYRDMVIGTAAPTAEETEGIAHHMVGVVDPASDYSVACYVRDAARCVDDILARGKLPIIVGGTGLYLDALLSGRTFAGGQKGGERRRMLEARLAKEGADALLAELARIDPAYASKLTAGNQKRIVRALEIYYESGITMTEQNRRNAALPPQYEAVTLGFAWEDRADMKAAIDLRVDNMVAQGLFDEVRSLLDRGVPENCTALQAIGYKEALAYLNGTQSAAEAIDEIKLRSRQYAKRQLTWFKRNPATGWYYWKKTRDFSAALAFSTKFLAEYGVSYC